MQYYRAVLSNPLSKTRDTWVFRQFSNILLHFLVVFDKVFQLSISDVDVGVILVQPVQWLLRGDTHRQSVPHVHARALCGLPTHHQRYSRQGSPATDSAE